MSSRARHKRQLRTVRDVLRFAVTRFAEKGLSFGHGSQTAFDEAVYLILNCLGLPLDQLDPFLDARLLDDELERVLALIEQRAGGVPAAYLTHEAWLGDYRFYVDHRTIIPRSLIAELLFEGLDPWVETPMEVTRVLDLCTGSGCLAIIAADVFPNAAIDAIDISADALAVAAINVTSYGLSERIRLIESDLFGALERERYDVILCNPPYVNQQSMEQLPPEYRREPVLALAGGSDGMDLVRRILAAGASRLTRKRDACLVLEIGHELRNFDAAFPRLSYTGLSTSAGDQQVLHLSASVLKQYPS
jgi:ribosomal protein L3 glutamine methyltransferase